MENVLNLQMPQISSMVQSAYGMSEKQGAASGGSFQSLLSAAMSTGSTASAISGGSQQDIFADYMAGAMGNSSFTAILKALSGVSDAGDGQQSMMDSLLQMQSLLGGENNYSFMNILQGMPGQSIAQSGMDAESIMGYAEMSELNKLCELVNTLQETDSQSETRLVEMLSNFMPQNFMSSQIKNPSQQETDGLIPATDVMSSELLGKAMAQADSVQDVTDISQETKSVTPFGKQTENILAQYASANNNINSAAQNVEKTAMAVSDADEEIQAQQAQMVSAEGTKAQVNNMSAVSAPQEAKPQAGSQVQQYQQIADQVMNHLEAGKDKEFTLQLQPENLGKIDIKLTMTGGKLVIGILAASGETQQLLASQTDKLIKALALSNVQVDGVQVANQNNNQESHQTVTQSILNPNAGYQRESDGREQQMERQSKNNQQTLRISREEKETLSEISDVMEALRSEAYRLNYFA